MNFDQPTKENLQSPENKIKEGVDFAFEQNPELAQIGTKEEYSEYLNNIFTESKEKNILYHRTHALNKFDKFSKEKIDSSSNDKAFYFSYNKEGYKERGSRIISAIVDIKNPSYGGYIDDGADGFIGSSIVGVAEPEQIHILNSKQDLENFKEFVSKDK